MKEYGVNYFHLKDLTLLIHYERKIAYFPFFKEGKYAKEYSTK